MSALVIAAFSFLYLVTPFDYDDFWFLRGIIEGGGRDDLWEGIKNCWLDHFYGDNLRIPQVLMPLLIWFVPRWATATISALLFAGAVALILRLCKNFGNNFAWFSLFVFMLVCTIPWYDAMFITAYQINYTWCIPLLIGLIYLSIGHKRRPLPMFFAGLLLGAWHESFAAVFVAGWIASALFSHNWLRADRIATLTGVVAGILCLMCVPGSYNRSTDGISISFVRLLTQVTPTVYLILWAICLSRKRLCIVARSQKYSFFAGACACSILMSMVFVFTRATFPGFLVASFAIPALLCEIFPNSKWHKALTTIGAAACLFLVVHLFTACTWTAEYHRHSTRLYSKLATPCDTATIFYDFPKPEDIPSVALRKPFVLAPQIHYVRENIAACFGLKLFSLIPASLEDYSGQGTPLPGGTEIRYWTGELVAPGTPDPVFLDVTVDYGQTKKNIYLYGAPFKGRNGKYYHYFYLIRPSYLLYSGPIKSIVPN